MTPVAFPRACLAGGLLTAGGCTPLGAWLYDDPSFALSAVAVRRFDAGPDSVELRLTGCNRNDFELMGFGFEARLDVAGQPLGAGRLESTYQLATRDSTSITMVLPVGSVAGFPAGPKGVARYELVGVTTVRSPLGDRRVHLRQRGEVQRNGDVLVWRSREVASCRPGLSTLPGGWDTRTTLPGPEGIPDRPPNRPLPDVPGGRPE